MYNEFKELSEKIIMPLTYVPAMPAMEQVPAFAIEYGELGERFNEISEMTPLEILEQRYGFSDPVKAALYNLFAMWGHSNYDGLGFSSAYRIPHAQRRADKWRLPPAFIGIA